MSSRNGVPRADVDVGLFEDPKVKRLARRQRDARRTLATVGLYVAAVLESWSEDAPALAADSAPAWALEPVDDLIEDLVAVELLDADGRVPAGALNRWMAGVRAASAAGKKAANARWSGSSAMRPHSDRNASAMPVPTYLPSVPTPGARARDAAPRPPGDPRSLKQILAETTGEPDIAKE